MNKNPKNIIDIMKKNSDTVPEKMDIYFDILATLQNIEARKIKITNGLNTNNHPQLKEQIQSDFENLDLQFNKLNKTNLLRETTDINELIISNQLLKNWISQYF